MPERTGGEWVVDALRAEGVRHVFGIPGVHNLAIYDALLRQSEIAHVLARHEQGAAFMADGYARASGHVGVVLVTTGPGATNTLTPLVESYASSVPVMVLTSDIAAPLVGRDLGAQGVDDPFPSRPLGHQNIPFTLRSMATSTSEGPAWPRQAARVSRRASGVFTRSALTPSARASPT